MSPTKSPTAKTGKSNLGSAWTKADIQQLWDLREEKKSWSQIGKAINRTGGAAQQQWMRMQREHHPLLVNNGIRTPVIAKTPKSESPDAPDGQCHVCGRFGFVDQGEMVRCAKCEKVYHQSCHNPPVSKEYIEIPWYCASCSETEASIGSELAESLHTALETRSARKQRKRPRSMSNGLIAPSGGIQPTTDESPTGLQEKKRQKIVDETAFRSEELAVEPPSLLEELELLRGQVQELKQEKSHMQQRLDEVEVAQTRRNSEMEELRDAIEGLKASLTERGNTSPLDGWFSKAKKRVTGFGGA